MKNDGVQKRRTAIYIRVSTSEQKIMGYGLESQEKKLKEYIKGNTNLGLVFNPKLVFKDVKSGSDLNRDSYKEMMELVKAGKIDVVLVWKIDRLSRSLKHLLGVFDDLKKYNVSFISMQENIDFSGAIGGLIFNIFGAIGEFERELIKTRTFEGRMTSADLGNYTGTSKYYGYTKVPNKSKGHKLELVPEEREWVEKIYQWYIHEDLGEQRIADQLNDLGVDISKESNAKNRKWTYAKVHTILTNSLYHGLFCAQKTDINGKPLPVEEWVMVDFPACVSRFTFKLAQETRATRKAALNPKNIYLLSGKLRDISLGEKHYSFVGATRSKGGYSYRRKSVVLDGIRQPVFEIPAKAIDDYVWGKVKEALKQPEVFIKKYLSEKYGTTSEIKSLEVELANLKKKLVEAEIKVEAIEDFGERGVYSEEKMCRKIRDSENRITAMEERIQEIEDELQFIASRDLEVEKLKGASEKVRYNLDNLTIKQKRTLCNLVVDTIYVDRKPNPNWKGKRNKWEISVKVVLRFNPNKFSTIDEGGRTQKDDSKAKKRVSASQNSETGGPSWN